MFAFYLSIPIRLWIIYDVVKIVVWFYIAILSRASFMHVDIL